MKQERSSHYDGGLGNSICLYVKTEESPIPLCLPSTLFNMPTIHVVYMMVTNINDYQRLKSEHWCLGEK